MSSPPIFWQGGKALISHNAYLYGPIFAQLGREINYRRQWIGQDLTTFSWLGTLPAGDLLVGQDTGGLSGDVRLWARNMIRTMLGEMRASLIYCATHTGTVAGTEYWWVNEDGTEYSGPTTITDRSGSIYGWREMVYDMRDMIDHLRYRTSNTAMTVTHERREHLSYTQEPLDSDDDGYLTDEDWPGWLHYHDAETPWQNHRLGDGGVGTSTFGVGYWVGEEEARTNWECTRCACLSRLSLDGYPPAGKPDKVRWVITCVWGRGVEPRPEGWGLWTRAFGVCSVSDWNAYDLANEPEYERLDGCSYETVDTDNLTPRPSGNEERGEVVLVTNTPLLSEYAYVHMIDEVQIDVTKVEASWPIPCWAPAAYDHVPAFTFWYQWGDSVAAIQAFPIYDG